MEDRPDPFPDLDQFRELAQRLPKVAFTAGGIVHPRVSLFAATRAGEDPGPVRERVASLWADAELTAAIARADADLRLYELAIEHPATPLPPAEAAKIAAYGMTAIEPGPDLFGLAALCDTPQPLDSFRNALRAAAPDPLAVLAAEGGRDVCALFGALIAARMAGVPVILDGANALAAAAILHALSPEAISHCASPSGSADEEAARTLGLTVVPCADPRALFSLASAILPCRALTIS